MLIRNFKVRVLKPSFEGLGRPLNVFHFIRQNIKSRMTVYFITAGSYNSPAHQDWMHDILAFHYPDTYSFHSSCKSPWHFHGHLCIGGMKGTCMFMIGPCLLRIKTSQSGQSAPHPRRGIGRDSLLALLPALSAESP